MKHPDTRQLTIIGLFTAIASVICAIPVGIYIFGVPATLQTFAIPLLGFILGHKNGVKCVLIYLLLGFIGIPVFNGFQAGPSVLFGIPGGFLFGFIPLVFFCGMSADTENKPFKFLFPLLGLIICHLLGIIQFVIISKTTFFSAFLLMSLPYLFKDIIFIVVSALLAKRIRKALRKASLLF